MGYYPGGYYCLMARRDIRLDNRCHPNGSTGMSYKIHMQQAPRDLSSSAAEFFSERYCIIFLGLSVVL